MSATRNSKIADVIVIGSGPTGGFAAHELARAGVKVLLIEAGQPVDLSRLDTHAYPFDKRGRKGASPFYDDSSGSVAYDTDGPAWVDRIRVLGGRSMHWNAVCLRFSADDFRERSTNGIEVDWPLSYDELAPHYTYVEKMIGVVGTKEGLAVAPDGHYIAPPPPFRCAEVLAKQACKKLGIRMIPTRKALSITASGGRGACHYCGHCMAGCHRNAIFTTPNTLLPRALRSKNLQVRTGALAREVVTDRSGRVVGVVIIDRTTKQEEMLRADAFVLGCGAIETPRLLLNSRSARTPDGLGNDNGLVGRYLTGHSKGDFFAYADDLVGTAMVDNDGALDHSIIPRFTPRHPKGDYRGGFQIQTQFANYSFPHHARHVPGFGAAWKRKVRTLAPAMLQMGGFGKLLAKEDNRVTVDAQRTDSYGIPLPRVTYRYDAQDRALYADMATAIHEIFDAVKVQLRFGDSSIGGFASHETGTCRMGDDPRLSVTNGWGRLHTASNVVVVDGSLFPTFPEKNPTLTLMALAVRNARRLIADKRRHEI